MIFLQVQLLFKLYVHGQVCEFIPALEEAVDFNGMRLLLVDDMPVNRQIAVKLLERQGFEVETAENGKEAVDRVKLTEVLI